MAISFALGIVYAIGSMICNGSFQALNKIELVQRTNIHPFIFNLYFGTGIIIMCAVVYIVLIAMGQHVVLTIYGVISGFLLSMAGFATFAAIQAIGLSVGIGIWSGAAVLVSFIEGCIVQAPPKNTVMAVFGVLILLTGIAGVAWNEPVAQWIYPATHKQSIMFNNEDPQSDSVEDPLLPVRDSDGDGATTKDLEPKVEKTESVADKILDREYVLNRLRGVFFAVLVGLFGGSVGMPSVFANKVQDAGGLKFLPSFMLGMFFVYPLTFIWLFCFSDVRSKGGEYLHLKSCFIPGALAGMIWNTGNLLSIFAIPVISLAVAYPIMQSALIIGTFWGIAFFKEITDTTQIIVVTVSSLIVIAGILMLGFA